MPSSLSISKFIKRQAIHPIYIPRPFYVFLLYFPIMSSYTVNYNSLLVHADGRPPSVVALLTTPSHEHHASNTYPPSRTPHPEIHMDVPSENAWANNGTRYWKYTNINMLQGMTRRFAKPYIVFYPIVSRDGGPLPINRTIKEWQQHAGTYDEAHAWRGNIVVARYCDNPFNSMIDVTMADFPVIKNYFLTTPAPPMN